MNFPDDQRQYGLHHRVCVTDFYFTRIAMMYLAGAIDGILKLVQRLLGSLPEIEPGFGKADISFIALEKFCADRLFQLPDLPAESGLGHKQLGRRFCKMTGICQFDEIL